MPAKKKSPHSLISIWSRVTLVILGMVGVSLGTWIAVQGIPNWLSPQGTVDPSRLTYIFQPEANLAFFNNRAVTVPPFTYERLSKTVLGDQDSGAQKRIYVDLNLQRLYAYDGNNKVYDFLISSGKWGRTPIGTFRIWTKLRATKMEGGNKALRTYYNLPNVPYTMFFYNEDIPKSRGFGIHGTYWHDNFGQPMSHGCINMKTEEAQLLYEWALPDNQGKHTIRATEDNPGTEVVIYGEAPNA